MTATASHVPDRGQIIAIDFDPKVGGAANSDVGKRRPVCSTKCPPACCP